MAAFKVEFSDSNLLAKFLWTSTCDWAESSELWVFLSYYLS